MEPVEVLTVLKLIDEPIERPELYDFRFGSGVVLEEDGVDVFRGSMDGDREVERASLEPAGGFVAWVLSPF